MNELISDHGLLGKYFKTLMVLEKAYYLNCSCATLTNLVVLAAPHIRKIDLVFSHCRMGIGVVEELKLVSFQWPYWLCQAFSELKPYINYAKKDFETIYYEVLD